MRKILPYVVIVCVLVVLSWTIVRAANYPVSDPDEGIYLTTFLLMSKGHAVYRDTFMSQPPAFVMLVYPLFLYFGKSITAARLTMGIWSLVSFMAVVWVSFELGKKRMAAFAVTLLLLTVYFTKQVFILQSDMLAPTFSLLALASFLRYSKTDKMSWFILCSLFINLAFYAKFDLTLVPGLIMALYFGKKIHIKKLAGVFILTSGIFFILFILPFGIVDIWNNVVILRLQSAHSTHLTLIVNYYLLHDPILITASILGIILPALRKTSLKPPLGIIVLWFYTTYIIFNFYRPLNYHHMTLLTVPAVLLLAYVLDRLLDMLPSVMYAIVLCVLAVTACYRLILFSLGRHFPLTENQRSAVICIQKNTNPRDYVITDEGILTAMSGRLPPPSLSDVSYIRITSGNLSPDSFRTIIATYRPKMIITWNGKLLAFRNFTQFLGGYKEIPCAGENKDQHMYLRSN